MGRVRGEGRLSGEPGRWLHFGDDQNYLALQQINRGTAAEIAGYLESGVNHLGFVVRDLPDLTERLKAAGYEMTAASAMGHHPHRDRAYFIDRCGYEWEFVQYHSMDASKRNDYSQ